MFYQLMDWLDACVWIERGAMAIAGVTWFYLIWLWGYTTSEKKHSLDIRFVKDIIYGNIHKSKQIGILRMYFKKAEK